MIQKALLESVLDAALMGGGDLSEIFFEDTRCSSLEYRDGKVQTVISGRDHGAGIRVLNGLNYVYAYTADTTEKGLMAAARAAATAMGLQKKSAEPKDLILRPRRDLQPAAILPGAEHAKVRAELAKAAHDAARAYSAEIVQATSSVMDVCQNVIIANSDGVYVEDSRNRARFMINAAAAKDGEMQTGYRAPGKGAGFEFFSTLDVEALAKDAANSAITMLHAPFAPAGTMPVVVGNGFGGVIFHEACGHSLESIRTGKNQSEFSGKMGQKVANSKVTAIDDGSLPGYWGSCGYDDEGTPTQKNVLIKDGVLTGNLVDLLG
ncbi:MAG: TldD/PmbA family protein, partial [Clostridiales bacterium]|nr:TldD/PmbA family protein [Clostridiales bacterium]